MFCISSSIFFIWGSRFWGPCFFFRNHIIPELLSYLLHWLNFCFIACFHQIFCSSDELHFVFFFLFLWSWLLLIFPLISSFHILPAFSSFMIWELLLSLILLLLLLLFFFFFFFFFLLLLLLLLYTLLEYFTSALTDGFTLEFEWQQVS